jgi:Streptomyces sporulation and cell division protein, SsgA
MSDLTAVPGRLFVLGDRLTVDVVDCAVTLWRRGREAPVLDLLLSQGTDDTTTATFDADLIAAGLHGQARAGSVVVWPCPEDGVLCIGLRGRRASVLELPYEPVAALLAGAGPHGLVPADPG